MEENRMEEWDMNFTRERAKPPEGGVVVCLGVPQRHVYASG